MDYTAQGFLQARILEWVAYPFSSGSSRSRNQTPVFCIADSSPTELSGKPLIFIYIVSYFRLLLKIIIDWWFKQQKFISYSFED